MATTAPDVGTGATVSFATSGAIGNVLRLNIDGAEFTPIEITNLDSVGSRKFMKGDLANLGGFSIDVQFPTTVDLDTLVSSAAQTVTFTFPGSASLAGQCFITKVGNISIEPESVMTCTINGVFTGDANTAVFTTSFNWTD